MELGAGSTDGPPAAQSFYGQSGGPGNAAVCPRESRSVTVTASETPSQPWPLPSPRLLPGSGLRALQTV